MDSDERIGDLVVVANGNLILVDPTRIKQEGAMIGHHGGLTSEESSIPLLVY